MFLSYEIIYIKQSSMLCLITKLTHVYDKLTQSIGLSWNIEFSISFFNLDEKVLDHQEPILVLWFLIIVLICRPLELLDITCIFCSLAWSIYSRSSPRSWPIGVPVRTAHLAPCLPVYRAMLHNVYI